MPAHIWVFVSMKHKECFIQCLNKLVEGHPAHYQPVQLNWRSSSPEQVEKENWRELTCWGHWLTGVGLENVC